MYSHIQGRILDSHNHSHIVQYWQARRAFDYVDANGSGRIELSELDGVLRTLGMSTDSDLVNQAMLVLDKDGSGDVSFDEFWEWWQLIKGGKSRRGGIGDQGKSKHGQTQAIQYDRAALEAMGGRSPTISPSPNGRRSPWGAPASPYGSSPKSPMMAARFAETVKGAGESAAQMHGDVLSGSPSAPKWSPPKPGSNIRMP